MTRPERFSIVASLAPRGDWRRALALDRAAYPPRAVVLSFLPAAVLEDAARLAAVARDVEAAARLHHPGVVAVHGLETVGEAPAVAEELVRGVTVRALLDAGGRLPPEVAARVAVDACAAVARAHALDAGDGRGLVHGALSASAVIVGEDGAARVSGFGTGGGTAPADDVRALVAVLHECLAGEPAGEPPQRLGPGVPAALAAAVDAATGASPGARPESAVALAQIVAGAGPVASHADVAAYAEIILPPGEGARAEAERALLAHRGPDAEEVSAELIAEPAAPPAAPEPTPEALPRPPATRPGADPAGTFAAPALAPRRPRAPAAVALVCLAVGFGIGLWAARARVVPGASGAPGVEAPPDPAAQAEPPTAPPPAAAASTPVTAEAAERARPAAAPDAPARAAATPPSPPSRAKAPARPKAAAKPAGKATAAEGPATVAARGTGRLDVSAPAGAEVFLDGERIGVGGLQADVPAGPHLIEVRLGEASVSERFEMEANGKWTYEVTPTPPR